MSTTAKRVVLRDDPFTAWGDGLMEFRLTYEGPILAETADRQKIPGRAKNKQLIRKHFHKQLKKLWAVSPFLSGAPGNPNAHVITTGEFKRPELVIEELANDRRLNGYRFVPLVPKDFGVLCALDVLFLRADPPGMAIHRGDIDNRVKTLFDALRMPSNRPELGGYDTPDDGEDPFFVLLEDDCVISKAAIEADTLLEDFAPEIGDSGARVVVTVRLKPYHIRLENLGFA